MSSFCNLQFFTEEETVFISLHVTAPSTPFPMKLANRFLNPLMLVMKTLKGHTKTRQMKAYVNFEWQELKPGRLSPSEYVVGSNHILAGGMKRGINKMG